MGSAAEKIAIAIIGKNEEASIGRLIASLADQTLFAGPYRIELIVYANGCTDRTAEVARTAIAQHLDDRIERSVVVDSPVGGKSRSWNKVVHEVAPDDADYLLFLDADIALADDTVCEDIVTLLKGDPHAVACTGRPSKSIARKATKSWLDRLSLRVSEDGRFDRAINGSLYCLVGATARSIWLPDETPGEDGFLNAMVRTDGFSHPDDPALVVQAARTTHYYDAPGVLDTSKHEQRMIVATMINMWMFEYFWSLKSPVSVAPRIRQANIGRPAWVDELIRQRAGDRYWIIRSHLVLRRLPRWRATSPARYAAKLPTGIAATALTMVAAWRANRTLRRAGAASFW